MISSPLVRHFTCAAWLAAACGTSAAAAETASGLATDPFWEQRSQLDRAYAERVDGLAAKCDELRLDAQAKLTRDWILRRDPHRQYIFLPPDIDGLQPPEDAPPLVQQWYRRFRQLRQQQAQALFSLAKQQLDAGHAARAYQLLHEVLHEYPEHEATRRILGYREVNGRWRKPEGTIRARRLSVPQPSLGFSAGQSWVVDSEHFSVTTNHSQPAGERLAVSLEELYDVWQQVFFSYWSNAAGLARRWENTPAAARSGSRHKVVLFRDRQQYLDQLRKLEPQIEVSVSMYLEQTKTAYLYEDAKHAETTWWHEVTHQLFSETGRVTPPVGYDANCWIVEGVALYMESLQRHEAGYTVGGLDARWLQFARYRALLEQYYLPLQDFVALGRPALNKHTEIKNLYSQAAGLAAFLMDYQHGKYREATVSYLQAVYQGRHRADTLASLTGVALPQLDQQYHEFLIVRDADLAYLAACPVARTLTLGRTEVSDAGLVYLAGHTQLELLDLAFTKITDAGLAQLAGLTQLKELGLCGTSVSDAGLVHLRGLKKLESLDVRNTRVTDDGWQRLQSALPSVQRVE